MGVPVRNWKNKRSIVDKNKGRTQNGSEIRSDYIQIYGKSCIAEKTNQKGENTMTEKEMENNKVTVIGTIVSRIHIQSYAVFGEGFYLVDLLVNRLE